MLTPYYDQDGITIYCGDCRDILPTLPIADLVLTDPPYGLKYTRRGGIDGNHPKSSWDDVPADLTLVLPAGRNQIIWGGNYFPLRPSRGWLVWHKRDAIPDASQVELAWTSFDMAARLIDHTIAATNAERVGHPTQKPLRVIGWCFRQVPPVQTVIDPFMGTGTTLVAARRYGVRAIGIERDRDYCDMAVARLAQRQFDVLSC